MKPNSVIDPVQRTTLNPPAATQIQAKFSEGLALQRKGLLMRAEEIYKQVLLLQPRHFEALYMLGMLAGQAGNSAQAVEWIDKAIEVNPNYASAYSNRGNALKDLKQNLAAIDSYDKAIAIKPDHVDAYCNRGIALYELEQYQSAVDSFNKAIAINPDHTDAHYNRSIALYELKQFHAAIDSCNKAIALKPDHADAYYNRGIALYELKQFHAAIDSCNKAIALKPLHAEANHSCGKAFADLKQYQAAIDSYDKAIAIKPDYVDAYDNRGNALNDLKQHKAAIHSYGQALAIKPDAAEVHWNQSLCYLQIGDFENGWAKYEWRWQTKEIESFKNRRNFTQPLWLGVEPLQGKTILLHSEQGLGDTIQFCRYARLVSKLGARVILQVQPPLLTALTSLEGVTELLAMNQKPPASDFHTPLLSLPLAFKTTLDTIPASDSYITSDPPKLAQWRAKLGNAAKPRVGLVWSGNAKHRNDANRSIPLSVFINLLPDNFQYISLQKELRDQDRETLKLHPEILHYEGEVDDFTDTAALCELVDIVISVDTSVAHLAGAMGKPVWILLPFNADWRWLLDRDDSPWYPCAKLYRQEVRDDWKRVFMHLANDLERLA